MGKGKLLGIDTAKFADGEWTFIDRHPFWDGFDERPERFPKAKKGGGFINGPKPSQEAIKAAEEQLARKAAEADAKLARLANDPAGPRSPGSKGGLLSSMMRQLQSLAAEAGPESDAADGSGDDAGAGAEPTGAHDGTAEVALVGGTRSGIDPAQRAAYAAYVKDQEAIGKRVLAAVFDYYKEARGGSLARADDFPELTEPGQLRDLMIYQTVTVHPPTTVKGKQGCDVGLSFHCWWDLEHGLGVRLRKGEVVGVGAGETAWMEE